MKRFFIFAILFASFYSQLTEAEDAMLNVPGGRIWYQTLGKGSATPVIVIHGGPGGSSCNYDSLKALSNSRPVILYDQLGAGYSDQPSDQSLWEVNRFAQELHLLINKIHKPKVHLLAHSWGAAVAAQYTKQYGTGKLSSIIYAGPYLSSREWITGTRELRKQLPPATQALMLKHERAGTTDSQEYQQASDAFYAKFLFHKPHQNPPACDDKSWNNTIYQFMWGSSEFEVTGRLKNFDATDTLQNTELPMLFMIGEFDEVPKSSIDFYRQLAPQAKIAIVKNAGHMSMVDEPDNFVRIAADFFNSVDAQGSRKIDN